MTKEEFNKLSPEEKDKIYKQAMAAGLTGASLGTILAAIGASGSNEDHGDLVNQSYRTLKIVGPSVAVPSVALGAVGAYKHFKYKKQKKEEDANTKK